MIKKMLRKIKRWFKKMFGLEVKDKDGAIISEKDYTIGCYNKFVVVSPGQTITLPALIEGGKFRQIYIPAGQGIFPNGIGLTRRADGSLVVANNSINNASFISVAVDI